MGKIVMITGGARSGKSAFAEKLAREYGEAVTYIATAVPFDDEMRERIAAHRARRPAAWSTVEMFKGIGPWLTGRADYPRLYLLDCITVMTANLLFERLGFDGEWVKAEKAGRVEKEILSEVDSLLEAAADGPFDLLLVTNEVGAGIVPENALARLYRDITGRVNQLIARRASAVYWVVSGIPVCIKGENGATPFVVYTVF